VLALFGSEIDFSVGVEAVGNWGFFFQLLDMIEILIIRGR